MFLAVCHGRDRGAHPSGPGNNGLVASAKKRKQRRNVSARRTTVQENKDRILDASVTASLAWMFGVAPDDHDALVGGSALFWMNAHWRTNTIVEWLRSGAELEPELRTQYDLTEFADEQEFDASGPGLRDTFDGVTLFDERARLEHEQLGMQIGFGLADDIMMRLSVDLTGSVGALLDGASYDAVLEAAWLFASPDREIRVGTWTTTAGEFYGPRWPELADELKRHTGALVFEADRYGIDRVFRRWGFFGLLQCQTKFGTPWWKDVVCQPFLDADTHHARFDGEPLEFPVPRGPERIDLLVNAPNELHGAEIVGFLTSDSGPTASEGPVAAELQRRREALGAVEPRPDDYPHLSELLVSRQGSGLKGQSRPSSIRTAGPD